MAMTIDVEDLGGASPVAVVVRDGEFTGKQGAGRFIKRATADYARMA